MIEYFYKNRSIELLIPILVGVAAFIVTTGGMLFNPTDVGFTYSAGDLTSHQLGWEYFRHTPFFQWPLGANPGYGTFYSTSIVYSDSIPLFAFFFRVFESLLPSSFQYFGIWMLLCFCIQTCFAWKLLSRFTSNLWLLSLGSAFFTFSPIFIFRLGSHNALAGQWVILASLYFYFSSRYSLLRWTALLVIAALVHAYLLAMVLAVWFADLLQRYVLKQHSLSTLFFHMVISGAILCLVMWGSGYFSVRALSHADWIYRMDVLSIFNSLGTSKFMPYWKAASGEGYNYFGAGMLGLAFIAAMTYFRKATPPEDPSPPSAGTLWPLILFSVLLTIYALNTKVAIGGYELFSYKFPIKHISVTFLGTGRFFWPVYYLLWVGIFYLLFTRLSKKMALCACSLMLVLQLHEMLGGWQSKFKRKYHSIESSLQSPVWDDIAKRYKSITIVLPERAHSWKNWEDIVQFAAAHRIPINEARVARVTWKKLIPKRLKLHDDVRNGKFDPDSLYVFEKPDLWEVVLHTNTNAGAFVLDGLHIVAPGASSSELAFTNVANAK